MKPGWSGVWCWGTVGRWHILFHFYIHRPPEFSTSSCFCHPGCGLEEKEAQLNRREEEQCWEYVHPRVTFHLACYKCRKHEHLWPEVPVTLHSPQVTVTYLDQPLSHTGLCKGHWCVSVSCREISLFRVIFPLSPRLSAVWVSNGTQLISTVEEERYATLSHSSSRN